jgi:hypothetical protein
VTKVIASSKNLLNWPVLDFKPNFSNNAVKLKKMELLIEDPSVLIIVILSVISILIFFYSVKTRSKLKATLDDLKQLKDKYSPIIDIDLEVNKSKNDN